LPWKTRRETELRVFAGQLSTHENKPFSNWFPFSSWSCGYYPVRLQWMPQWDVWFATTHIHTVRLWIPLVIVLPLATAAWRFDILSRRRERLGRCTKCNYDRTGRATGAAYRECGTAKAPYRSI